METQSIEGDSHGNETHATSTRDARRQAGRSQEVLHGEAGGLRRSGRGQGNGRPRPCPQLLSHLLEGSPESRDEEETRDVRPGTQPALRSDLHDEGRPRRGRNGHPVRKRSVPGAVRQGRREGLPLELRASGQGQLQDRRRNGCRPQGGLRQAGGAWLAQLDVVPTSSQHVHPQDGRVLRQLRIQRRGLHQHHHRRPHQSGIPHQHGLRRLHRLPAQVRQPPRRESGGQMHRRAG